MRRIGRSRDPVEYDRSLSRQLINRRAAFVDQWNVVFAQDRRDRRLIVDDEFLHGVLPFRLSVPHSHCNRIIEFDAGLRRERNHDQVHAAHAFGGIAGDRPQTMAASILP